VSRKAGAQKRKALELQRREAAADREFWTWMKETAQQDKISQATFQRGIDDAIAREDDAIARLAK